MGVICTPSVMITHRPLAGTQGDRHPAPSACKGECGQSPMKGKGSKDLELQTEGGQVPQGYARQDS